MYTREEINSIDTKLRSALKESRYRHTQGVRFTAAAMAMAHGADVVAAEVAGLLHDCAKCMSDEALYGYCREHSIDLTEGEQRNPAILHAKVGYYIARTDYGVEEEEILSAIRYHTTGRADMTLLEKIVFTADYIEPGRDRAPHLPELRYEAFHDLDRAVSMILSDTMDYLKSGAKYIDKTTEIAYHFYKKILHNA